MCNWRISEEIRVSVWITRALIKKQCEIMHVETIYALGGLHIYTLFTSV